VVPDLRCDHFERCGNSRMAVNDKDYTYLVARAAGWHILDGVTQGGSPILAVLCPDCAGNGRYVRPRAPKHLDGEQQLF